MLATEAQARISNQARKNLNDGISLTQVADSAIEQLSNITTRISELASQAANGAYSNTQRQALNSEAQSLIAEYNRIVESTKFNGVSILTEGASTVLQGGIGTANTLRIDTGVGAGTDITSLVGTGEYGSATSFAAGVDRDNFVVGDLNNDGYDDLIFIDGPIGVRLSNGAGGYNTEVNYASGGSGTGYGAVADLDNDGDLDILTSSVNSDEVGILLNNGSGSFAAAVSYNSSNGAQEIAVGDFNEDGNLDFITASSLDSGFSINFGNGNGTFGSEVTGNDQDGHSRAVKTADLDGDGHLDLVFGREDDNEINIFFGNGNGTFGSKITISIAADDPEIALADINGDGRKDIVVGTGTRLSVLTNQGSRTFSETNLTTGFSSIESIDAADYDGDGLSDIVIADDGPNHVRLYKGNANGTLSLENTLSGTDADYVRFGHSNTDGVIDILSYGTNSAEVLVYNGETEVVTQSVNILNTVNISTISGALEAIEDLQTIKDYLSVKRGDLGASISRANTFLNQVTSNELGLRSAKARISDIDVAYESGRLVRTQILQQSTTALLAQAGKLQNIDLKLLKIDNSD